MQFVGHRIKQRHVARRIVGTRGRIHGDEKEVVSVEARIEVAHQKHRAIGEASTRDQEHGKGELKDDQSARQLRSSLNDSLLTSLQRREQLLPACPERRSKGAGDGTGDRKQESVSQSRSSLV